MSGLSTIGSISFGIALVAGRKRVPNPATGKTALRTGLYIHSSVSPPTRALTYCGSRRFCHGDQPSREPAVPCFSLFFPAEQGRNCTFNQKYYMDQLVM